MPEDPRIGPVLVESALIPRRTKLLRLVGALVDERQPRDQMTQDREALDVVLGERVAGNGRDAVGHIENGLLTRRLAVTTTSSSELASLLWSAWASGASNVPPAPAIKASTDRRAQRAGRPRRYAGPRIDHVVLPDKSHHQRPSIGPQRRRCITRYARERRLESTHRAACTHPRQYASSQCTNLWHPALMESCADIAAINAHRTRSTPCFARLTPTSHVWRRGPSPPGR